VREAVAAGGQNGAVRSAVPAGLVGGRQVPSTEVLGYSRASLRD